MMRTIALYLGLAAFPLTAALGQDSTLIVGTVASALDGSPLSYAMYSIFPGVTRRFTSSEGLFSIRLPRGSYRLTVKQLGYAPLDTTIDILLAATVLRLKLRLNAIPYRLAAVRSVTHHACTADLRSTELGGLLDEVRKNAERDDVLRRTYQFEYRLERTRRSEWSGSRSRPVRDTAAFLSNALDPYRLGGVVRERQTQGRPEREMRIPQLIDLANESFLSHHCFSYGGVQTIDGRPVYEIDFEPNLEVLLPDVRGSVMLDSVTFQIRRAVFTLTRGEELDPPVAGFEVTTTYRDLFHGVSLFHEIRSVQSFPRNRPTEAELIRSEVQKLLGVRFLSASPGMPNDLAIVERTISVVAVDETPSLPISATEAGDTLAKMVSRLTASDLSKVGFYDREKRFPRALFIDLKDLQRRIAEDSTRLLPDVSWVRVGSARTGGGGQRGISISAPSCVPNVWVNGKLVVVPGAGASAVRRAEIVYGPELSPSKLGAIEVYPPGGSAPSDFPRASSGCGILLFWTRAEAAIVH